MNPLRLRRDGFKCNSFGIWPWDLARAAGRVADAIGIRHRFIETAEFDNPDYVSNPNNRCYYCKSSLYSHLEAFIEARGLHAIISGTPKLRSR